MAYKNQEDQKQASRHHYECNKQRYLERNKLYRLTIRERIQTIKQNAACADCNQHFPYYVMDFDHLDGESKENTINYLMSTGRIKAALAEIKKCEVVCANCHRCRTHKRAQASLRTRSSVD